MSSPQFTAFKCDKILFDHGIESGAIVVDPEGKINKIISLEDCQKLSNWTKVIEISKGVLIPGIVDSHVHVNSPGRSTWEDFPCATRAAAAGGVTTIADMPLNSIPSTTSLENLRIKADVARNSVFVDVAFWGGVVPGNQNNLLDMIDAGVVGFKCFLCPSGVEEFPHVDEEDLMKALGILQNTNSVLAFHAECEIDATSCAEKENPEDYNTYLSTRPPEMELKALDLIRKLSNKYKARYHIVHVSAAKGVTKIEEMKNNGVNITAETCPHYLTLDAENVPLAATQYKCAPPVRSHENQEELWKFIKNKSIDMIVSDHSPCIPSLKSGGFLQAWGGISSLQFGLSLIWTHASKLGMSLNELTQLLSAAPAKLCSLQNKKGALRVGLDADMIVFDPEEKYVVAEENIYHKNKLTPYLGKELRGKVLQTYLRGQIIYDSNTADKFSSNPKGKLLLKTDLQ